MPNDWEVLGLAEGAPAPAVRARWLELVKNLHPDRHADPVAAARLAEVNAAYTRLRTASAEHDIGTSPAVTAMFTVAAFRPVAFDAVLLASVDLGDVTDADEPFSLELLIEGGYVHVELAAEAGGSVVTVDSEQVDAGSVADALVAVLVGEGITAARLP